MPAVDLTDQEWQQVINIIGTKVTWAEANPLLMKIGQQLQARQTVHAAGGGIMPEGNGKEARHE
jgi:hypothetical protein